MIQLPISSEEPIPETWTDLDHTSGPTLVVDKDRIPLVVYLPRFLPEKSHVSLHRSFVIS